MKTSSSVVIGLCAVFLGAAAAAPNPMGHWARDDGATRINIAPCGAKLCATNTWVKDPSGDEKVGDRLVMTLQPKSATELQGQAYDERRKMSYSMTLDMQDGHLKTSGCTLVGLLCKTAEWSRSQ